MEGRLNINVSAIDYVKTSGSIRDALSLLEDMVHGHDEFIITDSEFAFGWHFFIVSVNRQMISKLADQMGTDFERIHGKGDDKKFITWLSQKIEPASPRFKMAIKEEMETSKYGIF